MLIYASAARVLNTLILRNDRRLFFFMFKKKRDKRSMNGIVLMLTATPLLLTRLAEEDGRNLTHGVYRLKMPNKVS